MDVISKIHKIALTDDEKVKDLPVTFVHFSEHDLLLEHLENPNKTFNPLTASMPIPEQFPITREGGAKARPQGPAVCTEDMLSQIEILRDQHGDHIEIPDVCEDDSPDKIKAILRKILYKVHVKDKVDMMKTILMVVLMGFEFAGSQYLSLNSTGFYKEQVEMRMSEYERILKEIGTKSYMNWSERTSPELKLFYTIFREFFSFIAMPNNRHSRYPNEESFAPYRMRGPRRDES